MKRIYLDYASTTPVDRKVFKAIKPFYEKNFANPSSIYREGVFVRNIVENSRKEIADLLHTLPQHITFTASGTESNNLAILGMLNFFKHTMEKVHFITSSIEHPSVLETFRAIEKMGAEVSYIEPEISGGIDEGKIKKELKQHTVLVSIMYANNEIGSINPIKEIAKVIRKWRKDQHNSAIPYFHTDASQAANYLELNVAALNIDLMTLDASKVYGPKGIGLLYKRPDVQLEPLIYGGSQEKSLRPGTENVPSIVGFSESLKITEKIKIKEFARLTNLRNNFIREVLRLKDCSLNGSLEERLPNNINICIKDIDAEYAVLLFDAQGYCISSVTSCRSLSEESSSYVVQAVSNKQCSTSSLRISLGRSTTKKHLNGFLKLLPAVIDKARKR